MCDFFSAKTKQNKTQNKTKQNKTNQNKNKTDKPTLLKSILDDIFIAMF